MQFPKSIPEAEQLISNKQLLAPDPAYKQKEESWEITLVSEISVLGIQVSSRLVTPCVLINKAESSSSSDSARFSVALFGREFTVKPLD